ncbi:MULTISPECIES: ABC transporter ATP-binding protein [unclassified Paenibacillus]|uniref:ABC transporter ATP-binding protein n=1 Tax=unclassified Paenibacillus TaxID=185978 RepID=UPI002406FBE5|nr:MULTISPECIES: ABC transporter ATP-binding protein [unclassified Paenibacillus]MDF9842710.1 ABC-type bacteriocin/lantibiotic exporter with double-glycine peptidase domain [Paenibacillus sp. PastF-2]MDF9849422.1 ABC-type bacteriocin/lantibiotic exporter with double-glycine peptidase domain [Paenibacillus sp. PastM-2]MDF9855870.1 ABC-type bacteriocin/lantibiotic exporter with double-glycine peptidase domain [Paenibacillus sp. PastF-1]MDH6481264.1 ABC-type bacteriocin/lantibiotic exporter with d
MLKNYVRFLIKYLCRFKLMLLGILLLSVLSSAINLLIPYTSSLLFDSGIIPGNISIIIKISIVMALLSIIKFIVKYYGQVAHAQLSVKFTTSIKKDMYSHLLRLPMKYFDKNHKGYLLSRIDEVDALSVLFSSAIFDFFAAMVTATGAFVYILNKSWMLLIISFVFLPFFYFLTRASLNRIHITSREIYEVNATTKGKLQESIEGIQELKQLNNEEKTFKELTNQVNRIARKIIQQSKFAAMGTEGVSLLLNISQIIITLTIGLLIVRNRLSIGDYVALTQYILLLYAPVQLIAAFSMTIQPGLVALDRVSSILQVDIEENETGIKIDAIRSVEFKDVSFKYEESENKIFQKINFIVEKNENVAIQGINGSGKTTIIKILLGLYRDYEGDIEINGINLKEINISSLRESVGIVSQNVILFSGTLLENIKMSNPNISELHLENLMDIFQDKMFKDIDPYSLVLNEKANNLSGGQKQKVAILRAFAKNPDLLIFDEATSNLDLASKAFLEEAIKKFFNNKICIIITHEEEISRIADRILEIVDGVIIEKKYDKVISGGRS